MLRTGTADQPSAVELTDPTQDEHRRLVFWDIPDAPVTIPLAQRGRARRRRAAGRAPRPRAAGSWPRQLCCTARTTCGSACSPTPVGSRLGLDPVAAALRPPRARRPAATLALIGNDAETISTRITELLAIINARQQAHSDRQRGQSDFHPGHRWSSSTGRASCVRCPARSRCCARARGSASTRSAWTLTSGCCPPRARLSTVVEPNGAASAADERAHHRGVRPDHVSPGWSDRLARRLAAVRDATDEESAVAARGRAGCSTCCGSSRRPPE